MHKHSLADEIGVCPVPRKKSPFKGLLAFISRWVTPLKFKNGPKEPACVLLFLQSPRADDTAGIIAMTAKGKATLLFC